MILVSAISDKANTSCIYLGTQGSKPTVRSIPHSCESHHSREGLGLIESKVLAKDDQRSLAFLATHESAFANCFPVASDQNSNFDNRKFETALASKMGLPVKILSHRGGYHGMHMPGA